MDEQRQRRSHPGPGRKQVDELPQRLAVAQSELGAPLLHRFGTVVFGFARPAREDFRVLGHAGAIVVFGFVVDGHGSPPFASLSPLVSGGEREGEREREASRALPFIEL